MCSCGGNTQRTITTDSAVAAANAARDRVNAAAEAARNAATASNALQNASS